MCCCVKLICCSIQAHKRHFAQLIFYPAPTGLVISASISDQLQHGLNHDSVFAALWSGARPHGNESADDMALLNKLAYWCTKDAAEMQRAFLASPHCQNKDAAHLRKIQRNDYLPRSIKAAIAGTARTAGEDNADHRKQRATRDSGTVGGHLRSASPHKLMDCFKQLSEIPEEDATWLIKGWMPEGQITLMAADGGVGKTTLWCNIIAAISSGGVCLLDDDATAREAKTVLFLTTEDSVGAQIDKAG